MGRKKFTSPTLTVHITDEQRENAIKSQSGGCLIADAIKKQYPKFTGVTVDMATIRVTDREAGVRYTYLCPPAGQHLLLAFDQGWPSPVEQLVIRRAVKVAPITRVRSQTVDRETRLQTLETKEATGEPMTKGEKAALTRLRQLPSRPPVPGPAEVSARSGVVHGGTPLPQGPPHPNLLRGRDRHFGAKLADPGDAFREAVDAAVAERLAEVESADG